MLLIWIASLQHHRHKNEWKIMCSINTTNPINRVQICLKFIDEHVEECGESAKEFPSQETNLKFRSSFLKLRNTGITQIIQVGLQKKQNVTTLRVVVESHCCE